MNHFLFRKMNGRHFSNNCDCLRNEKRQITKWPRQIERLSIILRWIPSLPLALGLDRPTADGDVKREILLRWKVNKNENFFEAATSAQVRKYFFWADPNNLKRRGVQLPSGLRRCLWEKINKNQRDPRFAPRPGHLLKKYVLFSHL